MSKTLIGTLNLFSWMQKNKFVIKHDCNAIYNDKNVYV